MEYPRGSTRPIHYSVMQGRTSETLIKPLLNSFVTRGTVKMELIIYSPERVPLELGFSPISQYMEDFCKEKMCKTVKSILSLIWPSPFSEAGSLTQVTVTHKKCPSDEIDRPIDHFRDLPTDSQTTDITHFAVVFNYDVTIKALEILRSTAKCLWRHNEKQRQSAWCP